MRHENNRLGKREKYLRSHISRLRGLRGARNNGQSVPVRRTPSEKASLTGPYMGTLADMSEADPFF